MSTPNPLMPQGSLQQAQGKSNIKLTVFTILAIHVVVLGGLLMQGCSKDSGSKSVAAITPTNDTPVLPPLDNPGAVSTSNSIALTTPQATNPVDVAPTGVASLPTQPLPTGGTTTTQAPTADVGPASTKEYAIAKGDTLAKIAKANGVTLDALMKANPNINPTKLQLKQKIQIPAPAANGSTAVAHKSDAGGGEGTTVASSYEVKPGDNLGKIAKSHGTSIKAIMASNNLKTTQIRVGQKLKLPTKSGPTASEATKEAAASSNTVVPASSTLPVPTTKQ